MQLATCRTDGCGNAGHPIPLDFIDPDSAPDTIVCGVCWQPITDVREDTP